MIQPSEGGEGRVTGRESKTFKDQKVGEAHTFEERSNGIYGGELGCDEGGDTQEDKHLTGFHALLKGAQAPKCRTFIERF